jgi:tRNA (cmo5U34)-methyltransferase
LSLEGVLVPVTSDWNIDLLKQAGFRQIDVFWKWMNFVGYIAFK